MAVGLTLRYLAEDDLESNAMYPEGNDVYSSALSRWLPVSLAAADGAIDGGVLTVVAPAVLATSLRTIGDLILYQQLLASPALAAAVHSVIRTQEAPGPLQSQALPWPILVDQAATSLAHMWYVLQMGNEATSGSPWSCYVLRVLWCD